jgi:hypothetical protein
MKLLLATLTTFLLTGCLSGIMGSYEPAKGDQRATFGIGLTFHQGKEGK